MTDVQQRVDASRHETSRHLTFAQLEAALHALPPAPKDSGRLTCIVRSPVSEVRELLSQARLSPEAGLPGDKWGARASRKLEAQLAVMQHGVAELIANGQSLALFGDNLIADLDLSVANLPIGSRLRVGGAVVEVTPLPHDGCSKFKARFGSDALRFVNTPPMRHLNLRGIHWRVIEAGEVEVGSMVKVLSRPAAA